MADTFLPLVEEGKPGSSIVLANEPDQAAQLAAFELQHHIRLATGAEVPIVTEGDEPEGPAIYVGATEAARAERLTRESFADQEYAVKITDRAIFLVGRDAEEKTEVVYDPEKGVYEGLPDFWTAQGTLYATYDFLEKECGVRWLDATRFGMHVPESPDLVVKTRDVRNAPSFVYRDALAAASDLMERYDVLSGFWRRDSSELEEWRSAAHADLREQFPQPNAFLTALRNRYHLHLLRLRNGGEIQRCNHSLYGYYQRFWDDPETRRPEIFAKGYEGGRPPQLCYTSPELIKQVADDARRYYDTGHSDHIFWKPEPPNLFPVVPNDNKSYCKCPSCEALIGKATGNEPYSNGVHSDYIFNFVNEVAKELRKTHPNAGIRTLAYMSYAEPPKRIELDPSVAVQFCLPANRDDRPMGSYEHEMKLLDQWAADDSGRPLSMWLYNTFPNEIAVGRNLHAWPGVFSQLLVEQMRQFHERGVEGFFHCGLAQDVDQYLTMRFMFDVDQDAEQAKADYFSGLFGAAAGPVQEFYRRIEARYQEMGSGLNERDVEPYTEEIMADLEALLSKADELATTEQEKGNLELLRLGIWRYLTEGMEQRNRIAASAIPTLSVPKVASAAGDPSQVDWSGAAAITEWHEHNGLEAASRDLSARLAHDGEFLYMKLSDRCDPSKLRSLGAVFPSDTWEIFVAGRRGLPFRQYAFNPDGNMIGYSHGEVNFRMDVSMESNPMTVQSETSTPDRWVSHVAWPLKEIIEGGVTSTFYLNIARVAEGNTISIFGPISAIREMQRAPEIKLED